jgi:8-oxo-dGTP pyrophosphatase MutT (NUDIX family)
LPVFEPAHLEYENIPVLICPVSLKDMYPKTKINHEVAMAYITNKGRLLVFRHLQSPDAGIQVPGGLIEDQETPSQAALREAREGTGLVGFSLREYLGYADVDLTPYGLAEIHRRHYFHLELTGNPPARWLHSEMHPSNGKTTPVEYEFFWVEMPDQVPDLKAEQDALVGGINLAQKP